MDYWTSNLISLSTSTESEPQAELSLPPTAQSRLAFFSVPTRYAALYKSRVYPIAERYGFSPVMAAEVVAPGDNMMAKVYALIERSALVVADLSSPNTVLEVGMVISKEGLSKPLILIADDQTSVPFDLAQHLVIRRPRNLDDESSEFLKSLEGAFAVAFERLSPALEDEPSRLLAKKEFRAAVIAVFSLLEHELRQLFELYGLDAFAARSSLIMLLEFASSKEVISPEEFKEIRQHATVRNRLAHARDDVTVQNARTIVRDTSKVISKVREANLTLRSTGQPTASD